MANKRVSFRVYRGSAGGNIVEDTTEREVGPEEAFVRVLHSGVCGTDEHFLHAGCVLGHEGAGVVEDVGSQVEDLKKGDHVGFGFVHRVCGQCQNCLTGMEQYCPSAQKFGKADLDEGSFGSHVVWDAKMLLKLPSGLEPKFAAPLMCAGATVWTALTGYGIKPGDRVGVQGIGGLGHLAIQFASKLGCRVVVLSSSESKREEATQLGATAFYVTTGDWELPAEEKIDHLLICGSANPDYSKLIPIMATRGTIYPLTVSQTATSIHLYKLVSNGLRIQGTSVATRVSTRRMLEFVTLHGIRPVIMEWRLDRAGVEQAMAALRNGKVRYRAVLNA